MSVTIVAEAGVNHNGIIDNAIKLVDLAADCGADYVKFQTYDSKELVTSSGRAAPYQIENMGEMVTQLEMLRRFQLSESDHLLLVEHCKKREIGFLSTAFDTRSHKFLSTLALPFYKIPSGEITNVPLLRCVAKGAQKVVLSTGMSEIDEVSFAVDILRKASPSIEITLLHCTTSYPTIASDVNLRSMTTLKEVFNMPVGFSDHTVGFTAAIMAVALGARYIEKHITLDRSLPGPDHRASMEIADFRTYVSNIREAEASLGSAEKRMIDSEKDNRNAARKAIVAKIPIRSGEIFTECNVTTKRPQVGMAANRWDELIGKEASRDYDVDEPIV